MSVNKLPPIPKVEPIDVMPVKLTPELWPNGPTLPVEMESYIDCNGKRCHRPKGEGARMRAENHANRQRAKMQHFESVRREELALKLDEIDPDWPSKFLTTDQAARFYCDELEPTPRPGIVVHSSPFEPSTVVDTLYRDPDEDTQ